MTTRLYLPPALEGVALSLHAALVAVTGASEQRHGVLIAASYVSARAAAELPDFDQVAFDLIVRNGRTLT